MTQEPSLGTRYSLLPLVVVAVVFIAASPVCWLLSEIHQNDDVISIDYENAVLYQKIVPFHRYASAYMTQGVLPLWNPRLYCGAPFVADFSNGLFQPLNAIFLALPTGRALAASAFVSLSLTGVFFVLFGRALGLSYPASLVGAVVFAFSGASLAASSRPAVGGVLPWAVLAFWALREFKTTGHYAPMVLTGTACALMFLAGGWGLAAVLLIFLALYALVLLYHAADDMPLPRFQALVLVVGTGLGLSAIQWGPSVPWLLDRASPWNTFWHHDIAAHAPTDAGALIRQVAAVQPDTLPSIVYVGIAALALAPAGLFYQGHKRDVCFFALSVPVGFALLIAPTSGSLASAASLFAYPAVFGLSVLAGMGAHRLLSGRRGNPVWYVGIVTVLAAASIFVLVEPLGRSTIVVCLFVLVPALLFRSPWVGRISATAIAGLLFFDLTVANANKYAHPLQDAPQCYTVYDDLLSAAEERAFGGRTFVSTHPLNKALPENIAMIYAMYSAGGSHVPLTEPESVWWNALQPSDSVSNVNVNRRLLDAMAVRALILGQGGSLDIDSIDDPEGALKEVTRQDGARLLLNEKAVPRALFVAESTPVDGVAGAIEVLQSAGFDPTRTATVDLQVGGLESLVRAQGPVPGTPPPVAAVPNTASLSPTTAQPGSGDSRPIVDAQCGITGATATRVVLEVAAPHAGISVLNDTHARGWRATLDGIEMPILRVNGLFRGVATPPGRHTIVFTYRPLGYYVGTAVSLLTLAALLAVGLRMLWRIA